VIGLAELLAVGLVILWGWAVVFTAWMLTHPPRRTYASAVSRGKPGDPSELARARAFTVWGLRAGGLELPVWDIAGDRPEGPVVVLTHGWGDSRIGALARLEAVAAVASRVIAWDLPGHGEARGVCTLGAREADDLRMLVRRVREEPAGAPIVLMGWSLGAGVSIAAAEGDRGIAGVIAESPYRLARTPARNVMRGRRLPWRATLGPAFSLLRLVLGPGLRDRAFDRARHAAGLACPLLVLHGERDEICPVADGRAIAGAAVKGDAMVVATAGHNDLWSEAGHAPACGAAVRAFIERVGAPAGVPV
jgi:pimeloyl-ACP methyl ester carboxylesterase